MNHKPYRGYLLWVHKPFHPDVMRGWYFAKVEKPKVQSFVQATRNLDLEVL
jgi:hypothetical protein